MPVMFFTGPTVLISWVYPCDEFLNWSKRNLANVLLLRKVPNDVSPFLSKISILRVKPVMNWSVYILLHLYSEESTEFSWVDCFNLWTKYKMFEIHLTCNYQVWGKINIYFTPKGTNYQYYKYTTIKRNDFN